MAEKGNWLDSAWNRHMLQLLGVMFVAGGAWTLSQSDISRAQADIDETKKAVKEINEAVSKTTVEAAKVRVQVERLQQDIEELNRKLDTLLWRTSPYHPQNQDTQSNQK